MSFSGGVRAALCTKCTECGEAGASAKCCQGACRRHFHLHCTKKCKLEPGGARGAGPLEVLAHAASAVAAAAGSLSPLTAASPPASPTCARCALCSRQPRSLLQAGLVCWHCILTLSGVRSCCFLHPADDWQLICPAHAVLSSVPSVTGAAFYGGRSAATRQVELPSWRTLRRHGAPWPPDVCTNVSIHHPALQLPCGSATHTFSCYVQSSRSLCHWRPAPPPCFYHYCATLVLAFMAAGRRSSTACARAR